MMLESRDNQPLTVHFCHGAGRARIELPDLISTMEGLARGRLRASYSSQFALDRNWQSQIRSCLDRTAWLVLLLSEAAEDRHWWLWEAGYFAGIGRGQPRRMLVVHAPAMDVPMPLRAVVMMPANEQGAELFLRSVFIEPPRALRPDLFTSELAEIRRRMVGILVRCCGFDAA